MIANKRPLDALSVLELAVLFTLYPVHHDSEALAAWHQSLASNSTIFAAWVPCRAGHRCAGHQPPSTQRLHFTPALNGSAAARPAAPPLVRKPPPRRRPCRRRLSLARTLTLMTRAQAAVGATQSNVDALEAAMVAGQAAGELLSTTGAPECGQLAPGLPGLCAVGRKHPRPALRCPPSRPAAQVTFCRVTASAPDRTNARLSARCVLQIPTSPPRPAPSAAQRPTRCRRLGEKVWRLAAVRTSKRCLQTWPGARPRRCGRPNAASWSACWVRAPAPPGRLAVAHAPARALPHARHAVACAPAAEGPLAHPRLPTPFPLQPDPDPQTSAGSSVAGSAASGRRCSRRSCLRCVCRCGSLTATARRAPPLTSPPTCTHGCCPAGCPRGEQSGGTAACNSSWPSAGRALPPVRRGHMLHVAACGRALLVRRRPS